MAVPPSDVSPLDAAWLAFATALFHNPATSCTAAASVVDCADLDAIERLVRGKGRIETEYVWDAHRALCKLFYEEERHCVRKGPACMFDPTTGFGVLAVPVIITEHDAAEVIQRAVERMNRLPLETEGHEIAVYRQATEIVGDFLLAHPFVDYNGRLAEILLAVILQRALPDHPIVHIGAHGAEAYRKWCSAVRKYQLTGQRDSMSVCISESVTNARGLISICASAALEQE